MKRPCRKASVIKSLISVKDLDSFVEKEGLNDQFSNLGYNRHLGFCFYFREIYLIDHQLDIYFVAINKKFSQEFEEQVLNKYNMVIFDDESRLSIEDRLNKNIEGLRIPNIEVVSEGFIVNHEEKKQYTDFNEALIEASEYIINKINPLMINAEKQSSKP